MSSVLYKHFITFLQCVFIAIRFPPNYPLITDYTSFGFAMMRFLFRDVISGIC